MVIVKLMGGLGNQMFQYAFGKAMSSKLKTNLYLDRSFLDSQNVTKHGFTPRNFELSIFNLSANIANKKIVELFYKRSVINALKRKLSLPYRKNYAEKIFAFDLNASIQKLPVYFSGFWQTEQYFESIAETIRKDFQFNVAMDSQTEVIAREIVNCNSVSIHFRRGDYLTSIVTREIHGICSLDYYLSAKQVIDEKVNPDKYFIFSDDIEWVKQNFQAPLDKSVFVNHNTGINSWQDMYLMSLCKHNIVANSSFSWWGAWLNANQNKQVVAPEPWFISKEPFFDMKDIVPKSWIRIPL